MVRQPILLPLLLLMLAILSVCNSLRAPIDMAGDTSYSSSSQGASPVLTAHDDHDEQQSEAEPVESGGGRRGGMALLFGRRASDYQDPRQGHQQLAVEQAVSTNPTIPSQLAGQVAQVLQVASNCAGLAALAFLGMQVLRSVWRGVENARQRYQIRSKSDAFAKAAFEDSESPSSSLPVSSSSSSSSSSSGSKTIATVEELQQEQEEIWRVVHNIYKGHADKIAALEGAHEDLRRHCTLTVKEAEAALSLGMAKLTAKLDLLEEAVAAQGGGRGEVGEALVESLRRDLRREMDTLRGEVPTLLNQHDKVVVAKLQEFGQDVKRLILQSMQARPSGAAISPTSSPKQLKKDGGKSDRTDK